MVVFNHKFKSMIFNLNKSGGRELRDLTGNYFANNDFSVIRADIDQATDDLCAVIGKAVYLRAEQSYLETSTSEPDASLVELVQRPIAILASLRFFRKNDISHEDSGRKVKLASDGTDKIPWEWQLDRDDAIMLEQYYSAVERLIRYLNEHQITEWTEGDACKSFRSLLIRSGREFDKYFPIDQSERLFILLSGFIREAQLRFVQPAFGEGWDELLNDHSQPESDLHFMACKSLALFAMATAIGRMPLSLIPSGVIRTYMADNGANRTQPASIDDIARVRQWLEQDAADWLGRMKEQRDGGSDPVDPFPHNDKNNKFFRL